MSEVKASKSVNAPQLFPQEGRLPTDPVAIYKNYDKQIAEFDLYRQQQNAERGLRGASTCARALHISLFFDGTNNNEQYDTNVAVPPHPSNIARLYHATPDKPQHGYFSYYMPGVGTPFPEIGEYDYSTMGMAFAKGGEDRINWGLLQLADALSYTLDNKQRLDLMIAQAKVKGMSTLWPMTAFGKDNRRQAMESLLEPLRPKVAKVLPKVLAIKLFVYGFSRGAAEARTFITWLSELFDTPPGAEQPEQALLGIPLSIEFLGLMDTVASVGSARATPFAEGHMDWADDTQALPDIGRFPGWVKDCRHFVAAHEQRLCFPLDSIRLPDGSYPPYAQEVIYPGMHSDVGGGYPPGDQGKARGGQGELLSQIALHDMYAAAFAAGAPLLVPEDAVPVHLQQIPPSRGMSLGSKKEFDTTPELITRFNAWRTTLNLPESPSTSPPPDHNPLRLAHSLEDTLAAQLGWLTGWRIERFGRGSYTSQPFYQQATQTNETLQGQQKAQRNGRIADMQRQREDARGLPNETQVLLSTATPPAYEPVIDQQQIREAAVEFEHDYRAESRPHTSLAGWVFDGVLKHTMYLLNDDDEQLEYQQLKAAGERCAEQLFTPGGWKGTFQPSEVPEMAALVAIYDDQVHDSRAWFLHDATQSREMWSDYFRYRMVFFDGKGSKRMTPAIVAGRVVGIGLVLGGAYSLQRHGWKGAAGTLGAAGVGYQVINAVTGEVVPFLPDAAQLLQPTFAIGEVTAQLQTALIAEEEQLRMQNMLDYVKRTGGLVERVRQVVS